MRHLKHRFQLGRKKEHREALMSNLGAALLRHGRIQTTLPKAKALRPFIEKIITLSVKAQGAAPEKALHLRRLAMSRIRDKDAVATLFNERAGTFTDRPGGYTRIYKLGTRIGDAAEMAVIQLIPAEDEGYAKARKGQRQARAAAVPTASEAVAAEDSDAAAEAGEAVAPVAGEAVAAEESDAVAEAEPGEPEERIPAEDVAAAEEAPDSGKKE
jgi:large subunit ribosomal protein L17